jgi:hypothetical protein
MNWGVICSETVLVVTIINGDLDGDTGVDETDDCGWDSDEVGVASVGSACKTKPDVSFDVLALTRSF